MVIKYRTFTCGVKFRPGFNIRMVFLQSAMDRLVWNLLLGLFKEEYRKHYVNCSRNRVNKWYTEMRNTAGKLFLRGQVSQITRERLHELAHSFKLFQETQFELAHEIIPKHKFGQPKFRHRGNWPVSLPLTITRGNTVGPAKFISGRDIRITKFGDLRISRQIPPGWDPYVARLIYGPDKKWKLIIKCMVEDGTSPPEIVSRKTVGLDRNVGNVALSNNIVIQPPKRMVEKLQQCQKTEKRIQRKMARCEMPNHKKKKPGSNRYNKQNTRLARKRAQISNIRHTYVHVVACIIAGMATDVVFENLLIQNMTKSAKGTIENPGRNVAQKAGLNRAILAQRWYLLKKLVQEKISGDIHFVDPQYTSQQCHLCHHTSPENRSGRVFKCQACGFETHADVNASYNIEVRHTGDRLASYVVEYVANAQVMGCLDVEGLGHGDQTAPVNRQALTGVGPPVRVVVPWDDV